MSALPSPGAGRCAVLVSTWDGASDLWEPFFRLLEAHWSDCPFPVYLGAVSGDSPRAWAKPLRSGLPARDWSGQLRDCLLQIEAPRVIVMLDDFFLRGDVSTAEILHCLEVAEQQRAVQVRLIPRPGPTVAVPGEAYVGICEPGLPYRLSTQAAIWDRQALIRLLVPGESIWEFESRGNQRNASEAGYYSVWQSVLPYEGLLAHHVIEKGLWFPFEKAAFARRDLGTDFSRRGTLPWGRTAVYLGAELLDRTLGLLDWRTKKSVKRAIRRAVGAVRPGWLASLAPSPRPGAGAPIGSASASQQERVSILMLTYARPQYLEEAIASVRSQTHADWELLIVHDGENARTTALAQAACRADPRIRYLHRPAPGNIASALNHGLAHAIGPYVAVLDDDDLWIDSEKLSLQVAFLREHPQTVACGAGMVVIDPEGRELMRYLKAADPLENRRRSLFANPIAHSTVLYRLEAARRVGGYDEHIPQYQDWDFFLKLQALGGISNLPRCVAAYRMWPGSSSHRNQRSNALSAVRIVRKFQSDFPCGWSALATALAYAGFTSLPRFVRDPIFLPLSRLKKRLFAAKT